MLALSDSFWVVKMTSCTLKDTKCTVMVRQFLISEEKTILTLPDCFCYTRKLTIEFINASVEKNLNKILHISSW